MKTFLSVLAANRLGFGIIGLTNSFVYVIMLSAAFDLLRQAHSDELSDYVDIEKGVNAIVAQNSSSILDIDQKQPYCNKQSTSIILLANTIPSLSIKIIYPFFIISLPASYKVIATALLSAAAFLINGLFTSQFFIITGVVCGSLAFGLGESNFMSITPLYGDASLGGWGIGTGIAAFLSSTVYALLRMLLSVQTIMLIMLIVPTTMLLAYFKLITQVSEAKDSTSGIEGKFSSIENFDQQKSNSSLHLRIATPINHQEQIEEFSLSNKLYQIRLLSKYLFPLLVVYFAEYLINQGLFELIYYPEVEYLDHAAQYRWFQAAYNLGVLLSRSSIELFQINNIWAMSILQFANLILFGSQAAKLIHLPNFYLVIGLIVYEGLLGGFTYVNAFYRIKKEVSPAWQEFSISTGTIADASGIVLAGLLALPLHDALCSLYV